MHFTVHYSDMYRQSYGLLNDELFGGKAWSGAKATSEASEASERVGERSGRLCRRKARNSEEEARASRNVRRGNEPSNLRL